MVRINSPGGTTAGSEALYASLRAVAEKKPVVAVMGELAASGGYIAAIAADHIVGRGNTLTGSIGVIMEYPDLTQVMARLGIGLETVRSSELKAEPSPFRPTNPAARALDEALVAEGYGWFRGLVGERRGLEGPALDRGGERRGLHRAAGARERADRRDRRRARGDRLARIARCGAGRTSRSATGRSRTNGRSGRASWPESRQPAGFSGKYRFRAAPSSIPSVPDSCQYGGVPIGGPDRSPTRGARKSGWQ